jgi:4a-hydroxytetrahydrobiopterin dehydratase
MLLSVAEITRELETTLPLWALSNNKLTRQLVFSDFNEAFSFMSKVAIIAEQQQHHPWWSNVYNKVEIQLDTHDAGGITLKDITLAQAIDALS